MPFNKKIYLYKDVQRLEYTQEHIQTIESHLRSLFKGIFNDVSRNLK